MEAALEQNHIPQHELAELQAKIEQGPDARAPISAELILQVEQEMAANPQSAMAREIVRCMPMIDLAIHAKTAVDQLIVQSGHQVEAGERNKLVDTYIKARIWNNALTGAPFVPATAARGAPGPQ